MKLLVSVLLMCLLGCGSNESDRPVSPSDHPSADTAGQQTIPQTPVSPDSAGARKNQERSSLDTIKRP